MNGWEVQELWDHKVRELGLGLNKQTICWVVAASAQVLTCRSCYGNYINWHCNGLWTISGITAGSLRADKGFPFIPRLYYKRSPRLQLIRALSHTEVDVAVFGRLWRRWSKLKEKKKEKKKVFPLLASGSWLLRLWWLQKEAPCQHTNLLLSRSTNLVERNYDSCVYPQPLPEVINTKARAGSIMVLWMLKKHKVNSGHDDCTTLGHTEK